MYSLLNEQQKQIFELKEVPYDIREGDYAVFVSENQIICETPYKTPRICFSNNTLYELIRIKKITRNSVHIYNDMPYNGCYYSRYRINHDYQELNKEYPPPSNTYHDTVKYYIPQRVIQELFPDVPYNNRYYFRIRNMTTCLSHNAETNTYCEDCLEKIDIYYVNERYDNRGVCKHCWEKLPN